MGGIWFACCSARGFATVRAEIEALDGRARIVRTPDVAVLAATLAGFEGEVGGVAVRIDEMGLEQAVWAIREVGRLGAARSVVALVASLGAQMVAQLFEAGATEVVSIAPEDGAGAPVSDEGACHGVGPGSLSDTGALPGPWGDAPAPAGASVAYAPAREVAAPAGVSAVPASSGLAAATPAAVAPAPSVAAAPAAPPLGVSGSAAAVPNEVPPPRRAPVVTAISGRGGVGKTTLIAAMACHAAQMGLRAAVLDLDLMFGNMHEMLGVDSMVDLGVLAGDDGVPCLADANVEACAMRVGPGLTLWGPMAAPERAELMGDACEGLISILAGVADVVFVDTSVFWGDAVAAAVGASDRCLVVGDRDAASVSSCTRAIELASRLGVPKTRMTGVFNRLEAHAQGEEAALRFEMGVALRSKVRIADGGKDIGSMASFGKLDDTMAGQTPFNKSVRMATYSILSELGCPIAPPQELTQPASRERPRLRLPWKQAAGDGT